MIKWFITWVTSTLAGQLIFLMERGIRKRLLKEKKSVVEYTQDKDKGLIVIIKPSKNQITEI
jgi:hypothetical protein